MDQWERRRFAAFTLIEVLVTITIIGILVSLVVYGYGYDLTNSRDQQRQVDLANISNALEQFYTDNHGYPVISQVPHSYNASFELDQAIGDAGSSATPCYPGNNFLAPTYISSIPQDPKNKLTSTDISSCSDNGQMSGQYLYLPVSSSTTGLPQSFELMAKMELQKNMSTSIPNTSGSSQDALTTDNVYYSAMSQNGFDFCMKGDTSSSCSVNYYLGPQTGG